ncbi:uncharacterized protein (UPF0262 family) [Dongia mobilis]|uniref:UPF0262 protein A8950_3728 n=1 Tax=Dongia mobilis TaxID=578943 RepID=A0A4R6WH27_9PROT|nr:UPF0262 family protein [Dongia mobilis]TDQ77575.1 uncharacterized protein (UPF0262 family) [Dongia mobilis]
MAGDPGDERQDRNGRLVKIELDEQSTARRSAEVDRERAVAIFDLLEENEFRPALEQEGPYHLFLAIEENRLVFDIRDTADAPLYKFILSLSPFRRIVKEYFDICESYYQAIKSASPSQIEAIDMGRRGLHNEGSEILRERLGGKVEVDFNTARRLFTLICALHVRM